ncbi:immunoglobulin domain-containing protein [Vibrio agarivorans]|uniref:immunoglobulin domain-containing protein n=1 Tax=Vibrio agarivorans TaxID=153622 RepID=UPI0025B55F5D|nr:immunoglobulin domain-containing protein [Vibrio agarivorans]MDN3659958.1 immunoglobulin domain-containing protein [Vibrio agarivorans]
MKEAKHIELSQKEVYTQLQELLSQSQSQATAYQTYVRNLMTRAMYKGDVDVSEIPSRPTPDFSVPYCVVQPADVSGADGSTQTMTTEWIGEKAVRFQWFFNDGGGTDFRPIADGATYTGTDTAELTINNLSATSEGNYFCRAFSRFGNADSNTANAAVV